MSRVPGKISLLFIWICLVSSSAIASDTAKEKRWADQIVDSLIIGEAVWLNVGGQKILGIYTEHETDKPKGAAIVLHGIGVHPNWPDIVHPLRTELPNYGWATLSLQMPILANEADRNAYEPLFVEVSPRLDAGIAYLEKQGYHNIVIIGHSFGSTMAAYALATKPKPQVQAFITVGMSGGLFDSPEKNYFTSLPKLSMPILDIYGSNDLQSVLATEKKKAQIARQAGNKNYRQIKVTGANHFFHGLEAELVRHVKSWLARYAGKNISGSAANK